MLVLVVLFVLAVVAFGRWQGIRSLIGLGLSFLVIVVFVVPAILRGRSPVAVALVGQWRSCWRRSTWPTALAARPPRRWLAPRWRSA